MRKKNNHDLNFQELWVLFNKPELRIYVVEEGADVIAKVLGNLFNGAVVENFSDLEGSKKSSKRERPEKMWLDFDLFISHHSQVVQNCKARKWYWKLNGKKTRQHMYKGRNRSPDILSATLENRKLWSNTFEDLKVSNSQPRLSHSTCYFLK